MLIKKTTFYLNFFCYLTLQSHSVVIHLFVHGTTLPGLLILKPKSTFQEPINLQSRYVKLIEKSRIDERFYDDSIMLEPGLVEITQEQIKKCKQQTLPPGLSRKAAIQAITIYDELMPQDNLNYYYLYGWSGLLDLDCRRYEAKQLYHQLNVIKEPLIKKHSKPIVIIVHAHSHGANIVLHLAEEEEKQHKNLIIDQANFYALPVQVETAHLALHAMFKEIIHFYSEGDIIQISDRISTRQRKSYRHLTDLISIKNRLIKEVKLKINGNPTMLRHRSFFFFNAYYHNLRKYKHFLDSNLAIRALAPIPIVALAPIYMNLIKTISQEHQELELDIQADDQEIYCTLSFNNTIQAKTDSINQVVMSYKKRLTETWQPYAHTNDLKKLKWLSEHIIARTLNL